MSDDVKYDGFKPPRPPRPTPTPTPTPTPPVTPGPCPIVDGVPVCPPPVEIDIIKVKKVFEEAKNVQVEEVPLEFEVEDFVPCTLEAECVSVRVIEQESVILKSGIIRVTATLEVTVRLNGMLETEQFEIEKRFRLNRSGEEGLDIQSHIYPECLKAVITDEEVDEDESVVTVIACVGIMIVLKLEAEVQLMVPVYGYPPQPPRIEPLPDNGVCPPDFEPVWPPYPPQTRGGNGKNNGGNGGCSGC
ncbi:hypothetical protein GGQ84_001335 [Desulfitispora alkaliphila]|uniref:hypothetical protein n=1 Tax=Desulfitispora alkaliphila TaxID=622674 RepID=UPI003D1E63D5